MVPRNNIIYTPRRLPFGGWGVPRLVTQAGMPQINVDDTSEYDIYIILHKVILNIYIYIPWSYIYMPVYVSTRRISLQIRFPPTPLQDAARLYIATLAWAKRGMASVIDAYWMRAK